MYRYVLERETGMGGDLGATELTFMPEEGEKIDALERRFEVVEVIPAEAADSPFIAVLRLRELTRYHVSLDGAVGPDVELAEPPRRDALIELPGGAFVRVYGIIEGADGSKVINASWEGEVGESRGL